MTAQAVPVWKLLLRLALVGVGIALIAGLVVFLDRHMVAAYHLSAVLRELAESDPSWRADDLMTDLPPLPPGENGALQVDAVMGAVPRGWPDLEPLEAFGPASPPHVLGAERLCVLEHLLNQVQAERMAGRGLIRFPCGRPRLIIPAGSRLPIPMSDPEETRRFATLMLFDVQERAENGDIEQALLSARACFNAGRSLIDVPSLRSQLTRLNTEGVALRSVEGALALGEASGDDLAALQKHIEPATQATGLLRAMRGERALLDEALLDLAEGRMSIPRGALACYWPGLRPFGWWPWAEERSLREQAYRARPELLRWMTRLVEAAGLPPHLQAAAEDAVERGRPGFGPLLQMMAPNPERERDAARRSLARVRVMVALVGCERYRLKWGGWPRTLDDLVPAFLRAVPSDPIDGRQLRYRKWADGVVVYSVGRNHTDDGGDVGGESSSDVGYRLWDRDKRRQPAPPLPLGER